jgi:hypothetical protein
MARESGAISLSEKSNFLGLSVYAPVRVICFNSATQRHQEVLLKIRAFSAISLAAMLSCVSPALAQDDASDQDNNASVSQAAESAEIQAEA